MKESWLFRLFHFFGTVDIQSREDFLNAIEQAKDNLLIDEDASKMIKGVMEVANMTVSDIMIPRSQMTVINLNSSFTDTLPLIINTSHSRFPVIDDEDKDKVIGILHAKDILQYVTEANFSDLKIQANMLRPAVFIPESKHLDTLLKEFRLSRNHLAVVVDEYGMISGLVTIEDVLEQIVGDIEDEFDIQEDLMIKPIGLDIYDIDALTPIEEFNHYFGTSFSSEQIDTVGGLILLTLGTVPPEGTIFKLPPFEIKITESDKRRIIRMTAQLHLLDPKEVSPSV